MRHEVVVKWEQLLSTLLFSIQVYRFVCRLRSVFVLVRIIVVLRVMPSFALRLLVRFSLVCVFCRLLACRCTAATSLSLVSRTRRPAGRWTDVIAATVSAVASAALTGRSLPHTVTELRRLDGERRLWCVLQQCPNVSSRWQAVCRSALVCGGSGVGACDCG